jgi:hypothetical protein
MAAAKSMPLPEDEHIRPAARQWSTQWYDPPMKTPSRLPELQQYYANVGITASALRNLGASGVVAAARRFLGTMDLMPLMDLDPADYPQWLDRQTTALMLRFPTPCQNC